MIYRLDLAVEVAVVEVVVLFGFDACLLTGQDLVDLAFVDEADDLLVLVGGEFGDGVAFGVVVVAGFVAGAGVALGAGAGVAGCTGVFFTSGLGAGAGVCVGAGVVCTGVPFFQ